MHIFIIRLPYLVYPSDKIGHVLNRNLALLNTQLLTNITNIHYFLKQVWECDSIECVEVNKHCTSHKSTQPSLNTNSSCIIDWVDAEFHLLRKVFTHLLKLAIIHCHF